MQADTPTPLDSLWGTRVSPCPASCAEGVPRLTPSHLHPHYTQPPVKQPGEGDWKKEKGKAFYYTALHWPTARPTRGTAGEWVGGPCTEPSTHRAAPDFTAPHGEAAGVGCGMGDTRTSHNHRFNARHRAPLRPPPAPRNRAPRLPLHGARTYGSPPPPPPLTHPRISFPNGVPREPPPSHGGPLRHPLTDARPRGASPPELRAPRPGPPTPPPKPLVPPVPCTCRSRPAARRSRTPWRPRRPVPGAGPSAPHPPRPPPAAVARLCRRIGPPGVSVTSRRPARCTRPGEVKGGGEVRRRKGAACRAGGRRGCEGRGRL